MTIEHDYITAELINRQMMKALELFPIYKEEDGEMVLEDALHFSPEILHEKIKYYITKMYYYG